MNSHPKTSLKYRADIDGLRALAVLSVVFFHGESTLFSGGFVGVDIFFVISGYLITAIIYKEVQAAAFSYKTFWLKRIRRIFPASIVSTLGAIIIFSFLLAPSDFITFGKSLLALGLFSSNIFFWRESGYFSPNAEEFPLLHTWSLAVEEQFYFFLPLVLIFFVRRGRKLLFGGLVFSILASFVACIWLTERSPAAAFYLLPTRAWELGLGSLLALFAHKSRDELKSLPYHLLSFLSLCLMVVPMVFFDKKTPFPSYNALYPVLGAMLFIWLPNRSTGLKALFVRPSILYVGKISYSLYLWHWIVFVAFKHGSLIHPTSQQFIGAGVISLFLAALSYHFIEQPVRTNTLLWSNGKLWGLFAGSILVFTLIGGIGVYTSGFPARLGIRFIDFKMQSKLFDYKTLCQNEINGICNPENKTGVFIWGDSHAKANLGSFRNFEKSKLSFAVKEGCPPLLKVHLSGKGRPWNSECQKHNRLVLDHLKSFEGQINLVFRYDIYSNMRRNYERTFMEERYLFDPKGPGVKVYSKKQSLEHLKRSLGNTVKALAGKEFVIWRQVPAFSIHPANYANKAQILGREVSWIEDEEKLAARTRPFEEFISSRGWKLINTWSDFCEQERCSPYSLDDAGNLISLYFDDDHLSEMGAERLRPY